MTQSDSSATGRGPADRARLARALRNARRYSGLGGVEAGRRAGMSQSKISKIERELLLPAERDVAALCGVYQVSSEQQEELLGLARGLREESSARVIMARGVAEFQRRVGQLESSATLVRGFQPAMVPGQLQTESYARCVFSASIPTPLEPQEIEEAVTARLSRRAGMNVGSTQYRLVLAEGALRWQACSPALMAGQIQAVVAAIASPSLEIGVIPWTQPMRVFASHGFHIYDDDAVTVGTKSATATLTGPADIATYVDLFTELERAASFGDAAREHLERIAADYRRLAES
ncbi:helix-turn-helix transcriptional regulator [Lipingzhangella sp. LS1_29]|uniref:Helix-turn-helix transcriptional regulator n=1 Tax=Lipingzhangella rawalii TaxID=2055835 RepID=A0ABU2H2H9_9ACTN|nr:helix-turn-helix transcriptional regulator [Lipingzhangella rawalii]MDS1269070.1 helix-turn-helix transcriptional regulator [Lipingzhangella rawalii]